MPRPRSWSDDDLRRHVPLARSWSDLRRRLGLVGGGTTTDRLRARCRELGLDTSHLPARGQQPRRWTDDQLRVAVAEGTCLADVFDHLGLRIGGSAWRRMQDHILRLGLDTSHWVPRAVQPGGGRTHDPTPIDDDDLRELLPRARSLAQVLRQLGLDPDNGSDYRRLRRHIAALGLSTDHLAGQAWARGRSPRRDRRPLEEILVRESPFRGGSAKLRRRLVEEGLLSWRCARCGVTTWNGQPAPLQLDHVNGDPRDNRRENLRLLCPNCHAQTPTYCGRNMGNGYSPGPGRSPERTSADWPP